MTTEAIAVRRGPDFPDSDGDPMPETTSHQIQVIASRLNFMQILKAVLRVFVGGNHFLYYNPRNQHDNVAPDVYVVLGVERRAREKYQTWDEDDKFPDLILEVLSAKTRHADLHEKKALYARLGTREYFVYDPRPGVRNRQFHGWQLVEGKYVAMPRLASGGIFSEVLGAELRVIGQWLRVIDPATGEPLPMPEEEPELRLAAEKRLAQEQAARQVAEERLAQMAEELARLKGQRVSEQGR